MIPGGIPGRDGSVIHTNQDNPELANIIQQKLDNIPDENKLFLNIEGVIAWTEGKSDPNAVVVFADDAKTDQKYAFFIKMPAAQTISLALEQIENYKKSQIAARN